MKDLRIYTHIIRIMTVSVCFWAGLGLAYGQSTVGPPGSPGAAKKPVASASPSIEKSGKNWKVQLKTGFQYEDNVSQNPTTGAPLVSRSEDISWNGTANASYVYRYDKKLSFQADYDIDLSIYEDLGQYDLIAQMWGLKPKYKLADNMFVDMQYFYIWNVAGGNSFSGINYLSPSFNYLHPTWGLTRLHYTHKNTDNFVNTARDSNQNGGGFTHIYLFKKTKNYVGVGYQITEDDSRGRFDRQVHDFKVLGKYVLPWDIRFAGEYKFSYRDYETFASTTGTNREDEQHNFKIRFRKLLVDRLGILEKVTARIDYLHQNNESNLVFRDFRTNRLTWSVEARF